jgi:hypothetical protein
MYKLLIVLCLFLFVQDEEIITWTQKQKLLWGNFKGEPKYNTSAVAITASGLTYLYSSKTYSNSDKIEYTVNVSAQFYPEKSWYLKKRVNDTVLGHEQLHFDITELYSRKFRKRVKNTKFTKNGQQEIAEIYQQINKELSAMQNEYDNGSNYSRHYDGQVRWQKRIAKELQKYKDYKEPSKEND